MSWTWAPILEFPEYSVNEIGQIKNDKTGHIMAVQQNQSGVAMVKLVRDGKQYTRSVANIVATYFVDGKDYIFETPINLNGNRLDCRAENLAWRPRWFAIRYHMQFDVPPFTFEQPIVCLDTDEVFDQPREAAVKYGLLEKEIVEDLHNQKGVWPLGYDFRYYRP